MARKSSSTGARIKRTGSRFARNRQLRERFIAAPAATEAAELFLHEKHGRWIESERKVRDVGIVVIFQESQLHTPAVIRHLNDDRYCRRELRQRLGNAKRIRFDAAV